MHLLAAAHRCFPDERAYNRWGEAGEARWTSAHSHSVHALSLNPVPLAD